MFLLMLGWGGRGIKRGEGESNLDCLSLTSRDLLYRRAEEELTTLPAPLSLGLRVDQVVQATPS